jgi:inositol phosphorylceramide synthase catalytic subunit
MSTTSSVTAPVEAKSWIRAIGPHALICLVLYALTIQVHFRAEYILLALFWTGLTLAGTRSRRFANIALPFLMVGILYDQILPHLFQFRPEPHVADLYHLEKAWFGIHTAQGVVIPSEWFEQHTSPWLDVPTGFGYLAYMFESFLVAGWMFFRDEERTARLGWAFLIVNILGFSSWIFFPAAPPWYVAQYGLGPAHMDAIPSAAGAARFDAFFGINYFSGFYQRSHNVYGAMPSLHVAYPLVVLLSVLGMKQRWIKIVCGTFFVLVAFAAIYLAHHYIIDAVAGIATAVIAWGLMLLVRGAYLRWRGVPREELTAPAVATETP